MEELKMRIIEFMRDTPLLWNWKHPDYRDTRKREIQYAAFAQQNNITVDEIKRIWRVLRSTFSRSHKMLSKRRRLNQLTSSAHSNGDEDIFIPWRHYKSMMFILENSNTQYPSGTDNQDDDDQDDDLNDHQHDSSGQQYHLDSHDHQMVVALHQHHNQTGSVENYQINHQPMMLSADDLHTQKRILRESSGRKRSIDCLNSVLDGSTAITTGKRSTPARSCTVANKQQQQNYLDTTINIDKNLTSIHRSNSQSHYSGCTMKGGDNDTESSVGLQALDHINESETPTATQMEQARFHQQFLNNSLSTQEFVECLTDDELYAKSLACTLRKFDCTTKEIIKLKFQEIIVHYMQQREQQQQQQQQP